MGRHHVQARQRARSRPRIGVRAGRPQNARQMAHTANVSGIARTRGDPNGNKAHAYIRMTKRSGVTITLWETTGAVIAKSNVVHSGVGVSIGVLE